NFEEIKKNYSIIWAINFYLNKNPVSKTLFYDTKNLSQKLDWYINKDKTLYIIEMKNNDLRTGLKGIRKDIENATKGNSSYLTKLININRVITENKSIMEKTFHPELFTLN